jgi:hypothetical protein
MNLLALFALLAVPSLLLLLVGLGHWYQQR